MQSQSLSKCVVVQTTRKRGQMKINVFFNKKINVKINVVQIHAYL